MYVTVCACSACHVDKDNPDRNGVPRSFCCIHAGIEPQALFVAKLEVNP